MDTLVLQFLISILKCSRANIHDDQLISRFEFASHVRMRIGILAGNFGGGGTNPGLVKNRYYHLRHSITVCNWRVI